jgi:hypothetical protein
LRPAPAAHEEARPESRPAPASHPAPAARPKEEHPHGRGR